MKRLRLLLIPILGWGTYWIQHDLADHVTKSQMQWNKIEQAAVQADINQLKKDQESMDKKIELKTNHLRLLQNKYKSLECVLSWCEPTAIEELKVEIECTNWDSSRWDSATEDAISEMVDQKDQCSIFNEQEYCLRSEKRQASCRRI